MGLSTINVEFKAAAQTAVKRSANGTVALILRMKPRKIPHTFTTMRRKWLIAIGHQTI